MKDLEKLERQVADMSKEIERLKAVENEAGLPKILWEPSAREPFYYLTPGTVHQKTFISSVDKIIFSRQQVFATSGEAEQADLQRKAKMKVLRRVAELNHAAGWVCDWDAEQEKYFPWYDRYGISKTTVHFTRVLTDDHYAPAGVWVRVIDEMEADVKLGLWGIK